MEVVADSRKRSEAGNFICFALEMGMLGAADSAAILLGSAVMTGLGYGSFLSVVQAILVRSMEPQHIAVAIATFLALLDIGMGIGGSKKHRSH